MIKIGIIGSGFGLYGLLPAFSNLNGCQVVAFCGKQTDRVLKNCEVYGVPNLYENWEEMLDSEDLDAVAIAVVPDIQYDICFSAIKKGIAVFAEKPLAISVKQAKELVKISQKQKITNCVDFIFPEVYAFDKLKKFLIEKKFGTITDIDLQWDFLSYDIKNKIVSWKTDPQRGGGALSFYFSHCL